jgi:putative transposase
LTRYSILAAGRKTLLATQPQLPYLYLLLDEWSRKAIQWRVSWQQTAEESRLLLEGGLVDQNILDLPEDQRPELINDRGRQMKAKPIQRLCEDHGMPQLFARPRTPNDNPYIESAFSTVKRAPEYPGSFLDDGQAVAYFNRYFTWYDTEHYHSGIDYVTPQQAHQGLRQKIVAQRNSQKLSQRRRRREENQKQKTGIRKTNKPTKNDRLPCSVIKPLLRSLIQKRAEKEFNITLVTNATTMLEIISNLRGLNARIDKANSDVFFGFDRDDLRTKVGSIIGTNSIDALPEEKAKELHATLLAYMHKVQDDHEQVKAWNNAANFELFKSIHNLEIKGYRNSERARWASWIMIGAVILGTFCTMIDKILGKGVKP